MKRSRIKVDTGIQYVPPVHRRSVGYASHSARLRTRRRPTQVPARCYSAVETRVSGSRVNHRDAIETAGQGKDDIVHNNRAKGKLQYHE